jgi:hypothetical protein
MALSSPVSIGAVGTHGQLWPEDEPTRTASASDRLRAEALGDIAIGIDASLSGQIDGPVWSTAGP